MNIFKLVSKNFINKFKNVKDTLTFAKRLDFCTDKAYMGNEPTGKVTIAPGTNQWVYLSNAFSTLEFAVKDGSYRVNKVASIDPEGKVIKWVYIGKYGGTVGKFVLTSGLYLIANSSSKNKLTVTIKNTPLENKEFNLPDIQPIIRYSLDNYKYVVNNGRIKFYKNDLAVLFINESYWAFGTRDGGGVKVLDKTNFKKIVESDELLFLINVNFKTVDSATFKENLNDYNYDEL